MDQYVDAKLDNGQIVHVLVPEGMSPDQAGTTFMQQYNYNKEAIHRMVAGLNTQGQHSTTLPITQEAVRTGTEPTTWNQVKDYARTLLSSVPSTLTSLTFMPSKVAEGLTYLGGRLAYTPEEMQTSQDRFPRNLRESVQRTNRQEQAALRLTGGDYVPQSSGSELAGDVTSGALSAVLAPGRAAGRLADALAGGTAGASGNMASHAFADPTTGQPNSIAGFVASALPFLARGGMQAYRSPGTSYEAGRNALAQLSPQMRQEILDAEAGVQRLRGSGMDLPLSIAQTAPEQTALGGLTRGIARLPQSNKTQAVLRASQGDDPSISHNLADTIEGNQLFAEEYDPVLERLAKRVRAVDTLRGANAGPGPITGATTEEMGHLALLLHGAEGIMPEWLKAATVGGKLATWDALKRFKLGPQMEAADQMAASPTLNEFERLANTNTKLPIFRTAFQGAFGVPGGLGYFGTPGDTQQ